MIIIIIPAINAIICDMIVLVTVSRALAAFVSDSYVICHFVVRSRDRESFRGMISRRDIDAGCVKRSDRRYHLYVVIHFHIICTLLW